MAKKLHWHGWHLLMRVYDLWRMPWCEQLWHARHCLGY